jgi:hypothetical protein
VRTSARQVSQLNGGAVNGGDETDTWRQQAQDLSHNLRTRLGWSLGWRPSSPLWQKGLLSLVMAVAVRILIGAATFSHQRWSKRRRSGGGRKARRREGGGGGVHSVRSVRSAVGDAMLWLRHLAAVPMRLAVEVWWRAAAAAAARARAIHASLVRRVHAVLALPVVLLRRLRACVRWPALRRAPAPPTTTTTSEASSRQSEDGNECVVCMDAAKEAVIIPCYHL